MRQSYIYNILTEHKYWGGFTPMWKLIRYNKLHNNITLIISIV